MKHLKTYESYNINHPSFEDYDGYLYHGTTDKHLDNILENGLENFYLGSYEVAVYYSEVVVDEDGGEPIVIAIPMDNLDKSKIKIDYPSIEEPLTFTLGESEDDLYELWETSNKTWIDCLNIYQSALYEGSVEISETNISYPNDI